MLKLYETFKGAPVLSLRAGGRIGYAVEAILNPNNLFIEGWYVEDSRSREVLILLTKDIRDVLPQGIAIDDHEVLSSENDLIRLQDIIGLRFSLTGMKVQSQNGRHYGKITDFAFDTLNFHVQKLYASQPIVKNLTGGNISIDRSQIVEITNRRIIIEDPTERSSAPATAPLPAN